MGVDSSEKYTLFFLALCTLCLTTTIIIYCHHADHTSKEESLDEIKAQVDVLRERVTDLLLEVEQGGRTHSNKLDIGDSQPRIDRPAGHVKVDRRKVYATLYHNTANDVGYVWGLRVMIHSARLAGCKQPFVVMHLMSFEQVEKSLGHEVMRELMEANVSFRKIESVDKVFGSGAFAHIAKSRWQVAINKVRVWEMTEFEKVLFIDLDSVVLKNLDFLFSYPELTVSNDQAALDKMRTYEVLNPGFMLVQPNASTFQSFVRFSKRISAEDSVMSTAEQGMLISLYPHPVLLPNTFAMTPAAAPLLIDREFGWADVFSLHFYDTETEIVPKPWTVAYPLTPSGKGHHWDVPYALWWQARQRLVSNDRRPLEQNGFAVLA